MNKYELAGLIICPLPGMKECIKEECSWYDKDKGQCNEVSKRQALEAIAKALNSTLKIEGRVYTHPF